MKQMFLELRGWAKENPKEFIANVLFVVGLFAFFYFAMWFGAIMEGRA